jgi:hypothetical protein
MFRLAVLCLAVWAAAAGAAPPVVEFEAKEVAAKKHSFVVLKAKVANGKGATKYLKPAAGLSYLPSELLADPSAIVFIPVEDGVYTFWAWAGNEDGASDRGVVRVGGGKGDAAPPPVTDPKDPPAEGGKLFFVVARPDGPVDPKVAAAVRLPAWDELRKAGHAMKDYPASELPKGVAAPEKLPAVVVLRVSADGRSSSKVEVADLPATDEAVRRLAK